MKSLVYVYDEQQDKGQHAAARQTLLVTKCREQTDQTEGGDRPIYSRTWMSDLTHRHRMLSQMTCFSVMLCFVKGTVMQISVEQHETAVSWWQVFDFMPQLPRYHS